jgi:hypothetical protein
MCSQIQITDSDVETGLAAYIGIRRLRMDQELATARRGRVQLVRGINLFLEDYKSIAANCKCNFFTCFVNTFIMKQKSGCFIQCFDA